MVRNLRVLSRKQMTSMLQSKNMKTKCNWWFRAKDFRRPGGRLLARLFRFRDATPGLQDVPDHCIKIMAEYFYIHPVGLRVSLAVRLEPGVHARQRRGAPGLLVGHLVALRGQNASLAGLSDRQLQIVADYMELNPTEPRKTTRGKKYIDGKTESMIP